MNGFKSYRPITKESFINWYENSTDSSDEEEKDKRKAMLEKSIDNDRIYMEKIKAKIIKEKKFELNKRAKIAFEEFKEQHPELRNNPEKLKRTFGEMYAWEQERTEVDYIFRHKYKDFYDRYEKLTSYRDKPGSRPFSY